MDESRFKAMAEKNTILRCLVGSQAYGTNLAGAGDRDEKGVCIEPVEFGMGFSPFEQYEFRSSVERGEGNSSQSKPGDLDLTIYSLRKFLRLALHGNPTIVEMLYIKPLSTHPLGTRLQALAPSIISRQCGKRYLGYMEAQRQKLVGEIGQKRVNRPDLEEKHGYDTKYAMHIVRLGLQGVELLSTGKLTIPVVEAERTYLQAIRAGLISLQDVLTRSGELEQEVKDLISDGPLQDLPNTAVVEDWMISTYWEMWKAQRFMIDRSPTPWKVQ